MYENRPEQLHRNPNDNGNGQAVGQGEPPITGVEYPYFNPDGGPNYPVPYQLMQQPQAPQLYQQYPQLQPYQPPVSYLPQQHKNTESGNGSGGFKLPVNEIKTIVDRMGGLDGIMSTVSKMQKLVTSVQEVTPMLRSLLGSFGKKAATTGTHRHRSRSRTSTGPSKRSRNSHSRKRSAAKRRRQGSR
ncbi:hypothetical protein [Ferviditalea candida]|uniref:Tyrosine protein kinase n=1 Tax=Ferviditalea candida TaxID=3108399 RepID=A0ABU5ZLR4_9BACL|nr:hypothetical protein [Paenibacillaceae bacterium T2]